MRLWAFLIILCPQLLVASPLMGRFVRELPRASISNEGPHWVSEWQAFDLPAGLQSLQIVVRGSDDQLLQVTDLIDPAGTAWVQSGGAPHKPLHSYSQPILRNTVSPLRSSAVMPGLGTLTLPQSRRAAPLLPGTWKLRSLSWKRPATLEVRTFLIGQFPEPGRVRSRIPIRLWISPQGFWANSEARLGEVLELSKEHFRQIGLELSVLSAELLPEPVQLTEIPKSLVPLGLQFGESDAINVFLTEGFTNQKDGMNGYACIGGPRGLPISHGCLVAIFAANGAEKIPVEQRAKILTHEVSHYLGLYHTRDEGQFMLNVIFDPFEDTSELVTGENMMDPGLHTVKPGFSREQREILSLSPVLQ